MNLQFRAQKSNFLSYVLHIDINLNEALNRYNVLSTLIKQVVSESIDENISFVDCWFIFVISKRSYPFVNTNCGEHNTIRATKPSKALKQRE